MSDVEKSHRASLAGSPLGFCPTCGAMGINRERGPNGNDLCQNGHTYPSRSSVDERGGQAVQVQVLGPTPDIRNFLVRLVRLEQDAAKIDWTGEDVSHINAAALSSLLLQHITGENDRG